MQRTCRVTDEHSTLNKVRNTIVSDGPAIRRWANELLNGYGSLNIESVGLLAANLYSKPYGETAATISQVVVRNYFA